MKKYFWLILLIILSGLRLLWLDRFPPGLAHDEAEYILSAKTLVKFGVDLSGTRFPLSIFKTGTSGILSPLPHFLLAPYYAAIPWNQASLRLPFVILNLLTGVTIYLLSLQLFRKKNMALITLMLWLISPWSIYFSRVAGDVCFALLFYALGILTFLKYSGKKLIIPLLMFGLGFLSYQGAQPVLPLLLIAGAVYKNHFRSSISFLLGAGIILGAYFLISASLQGSNLAQKTTGLIFSSPEALSSMVNDQRRLSIDNPFINITSNKATALINIMTEKYLTTFSPDILFLHGDLRATYRFGEHGLLYLADIPFLIAGWLWIFNRRKKAFWYLTALILISPIATAISSVETSVINRSFMLLLVFTLISGAGVKVIYEFLTGKIGRLASGCLLGVVLAISLGNFLIFYFFRFPVVAAENFFMSEKIIANYVLKNGLNNKVLVLADNPRAIFVQTMIYSYFYPGKDLLNKQALTGFINGEYKMGQVEFSKDCSKISSGETGEIIYQNSLQKCAFAKPVFSINENHYGGALYYFNSSQMCQKYSTDIWRRTYLTADYLMEKLPAAQFCNRWIMRQ